MAIKDIITVIIAIASLAWGIITYIDKRKIEEKRNIEKKKFSEEERKFTEKIKKLENDLERSSLKSKMYYEKEFMLADELWRALLNLRLEINNLSNSIRVKKGNTEENLEQINLEMNEKRQSFSKKLNESRPFINKELFNLMKSCVEIYQESIENQIKLEKKHGGYTGLVPIEYLMSLLEDHNSKIERCEKIYSKISDLMQSYIK